MLGWVGLIFGPSGMVGEVGERSEFGPGTSGIGIRHALWHVDRPRSLASPAAFQYSVRICYVRASLPDFIKYSHTGRLISGDQKTFSGTAQNGCIKLASDFFGTGLAHLFCP